MLMSTAPVRAARSSVTVPVVRLKRLNCVEKPKWLYEKRGKVWPASSLYVSGAASAGAATVAKASAATRVFSEVMAVLQ